METFAILRDLYEIVLYLAIVVDSENLSKVYVKKRSKLYKKFQNTFHLRKFYHTKLSQGPFKRVLIKIDIVKRFLGEKCILSDTNLEFFKQKLTLN